MKIEFSRWILESSDQRSNVMTIRLVGAEFLHAEGRMDGQTDRQTDQTNLIIPFCSFTTAPKILRLHMSLYILYILTL